jgi:hypothetical protein
MAYKIHYIRKQKIPCSLEKSSSIKTHKKSKVFHPELQRLNEQKTFQCVIVQETHAYQERSSAPPVNNHIGWSVRGQLL